MQDADPTWKTSVHRVAVYEKERLAGNFDLSSPVTTDAHAATYWPNMNLMSTGYSVCTLTPSGGSIQVTGAPNCTQWAADGSGTSRSPCPSPSPPIAPCPS